MKATNTIRKQFLTNRDETGRFIVKSLKSGRVYFVEPIHKGNGAKWGDIDPASKKITGNYGRKYKGSVTEKESMITKENGFKAITTVKGSPFWEIEQRDQAYLNG
ncbi:MAG: hypothetical protein ACI837_000525 [Crocinitomicaceae bacterium]|jgi:hypothetical protein